MKTISRRISQTVLVATILSASVVMAGARSVQEVLIFDRDGLAEGDLGAVYNAADPNEFMGCQVYAGAADPVATCLARDTNNDLRGCSTSDPELIATIRTLKEDSALTFEWSDTGGCSFISVWNESQTLPR